jgi:hypothetical protein
MAPATTPHRTAPRRYPNRPSRNNSSDRQSSRKRFWATLILGFVLGILATRFVNFAYESDAELQRVVKNAAYSGAVLDLPTFQSQPPTGTAKLRVGATNSTQTTDNDVSPTDNVNSTSPAPSSTQKIEKEVPKTLTQQNNEAPRKEIDAGNRVPEMDQKIAMKGNQTVTTTTLVTDDEIVDDFQRVDRVVIATKMHGPNSVTALKQSLCLLKYAYNDRLNYDILVFSSEPVPEEALAPIRQMVAPANFTFVVDNPGLQTMLQALTPEQQAHLLERCDTKSLDQISWTTRCFEMAYKRNTTEYISYTWQAEFRALHIWKHQALAPYKYMLWMDTDGFCSKKWEKDPIATMARHDLVLFFDNFPQGASQGYEWPGIFHRAFNQSVCSVWLSSGNVQTALGGRYLTAATGGTCKRPRLTQVHGFFHITNLDFYRSDPVMHWARTLIGDSKFSRKFDDQIAITIPAAVLAPKRSWDMRSNGFNMSVFHNYRLDGKKKENVGGYEEWWKKDGKEEFPEAWGKCEVEVSG